MPTIRTVTREEIQAAAEAEGYVVTFMPERIPGRITVTVKSQLVVTHTKKGERVEEVVEYKPNDCEPFRWMIVGLFGERKGFQYTIGTTMYDGSGDKIEYVAPVVKRPPLTKAHKKALQEGRKRAFALKRELKAQEAAEAPEVIRKPRKTKTVARPSKDDSLFAQGFYRVPCHLCGQGIKRTGKRGKAPLTHKDGCP